MCIVSLMQNDVHCLFDAKCVLKITSDECKKKMLNLSGVDLICLICFVDKCK